jgi:hypothetical protein
MIAGSIICPGLSFSIKKDNFRSKIIFLEKIMEAVASVGSKVEKLKANQAMMAGRIQSTSHFEVKGRRVFEAVVVTPAADAYSMPGVVAIQSSYKLGNPGEDISVHVAVSGIPNSWADGKTGEVKNSANVRLSVVE